MLIAKSLIVLSLLASTPQAPAPDAAAAAFLDAFKAMDEARFDRFFAPDVTIFFPSGSLSKERVEGKAVVLAAFHRFFAQLRAQGSTRLDIKPLDQQIQRHGDIAVVTFRLDSKDEVGRRTIILRRDGADWRIIHLHASIIAK